jgi:hypothetical protein
MRPAGFATTARRISDEPADPAAVQALGAPIKDGWFPIGSIEGGGSSGSSDPAIFVSGPKARGTLHVRATSSMGDWRLTMLVLQLKGTGERIDLLAGSNPWGVTRPPVAAGPAVGVAAASARR